MCRNLPIVLATSIIIYYIVNYSAHIYGLDDTFHRAGRTAYPRHLDRHSHRRVQADHRAASSPRRATRLGRAAMTIVDYIIVVGFLSVMAVAGLWISRLIKNSD